MKCEECQKNLLDYLTHKLSGETKGAVDDHVAECGACRAELAEFRVAWEALGTLPEDEPSPELSAGFYAMLEEAKAEQGPGR
jgi:predicted anti-sigma-YlaC factor YlaD